MSAAVAPVVVDVLEIPEFVSVLSKLKVPLVLLKLVYVRLIARKTYPAFKLCVPRLFATPATKFREK
jgi:hypothetical protein